MELRRLRKTELATETFKPLRTAAISVFRPVLRHYTVATAAIRDGFQGFAEGDKQRLEHAQALIGCNFMVLNRRHVRGYL